VAKGKDNFISTSPFDIYHSKP